MGARPGSSSKTGEIQFCSTRMTSNLWLDVMITFNFFCGGVVSVLLCVCVCCLVVFFLLFITVYNYVGHKRVIGAVLTTLLIFLIALFSVFERYKNYSPYDMLESIKKEVKGDLENAFLNLGKHVWPFLLEERTERGGKNGHLLTSRGLGRCGGFPARLGEL